MRGLYLLCTIIAISVRADVACTSMKVPMVRAALTPSAGKLSASLTSTIAAADAAELTVLVDLRDQLDFARTTRLTKMSRASRRRCAATLLKRVAARGQKRVIAVLKRLQRENLVQKWTSITIVNRFIVIGKPQAIRKLAALPEVASIEEEVRGEGYLQSNLERDSPPAGPANIGVENAWRAGIDGRGVIVGIIDSGASAQHEQLRENYRGGRTSWFDPTGKSSQPIDAGIGHGTAVLSCAVGVNADGHVVGIAPRAHWIAAAGLEWSYYSSVSASLAADWMLHVGRPDVLIIAWRVPKEGCDRSLTPIVNAWRAAGIVVVFAAGNSGPAPASDVSPANYCDLFPGDRCALSVGVVNSDRIADEGSSRGPNSCNGDVFPRVVTIAANVPVAVPLSESTYRTATGSSYAAGYTAGVAALLLQRVPNASAEDIEDAIVQTAQDLGPPGPDSTYGFGLIDLNRALGALLWKNAPSKRPNRTTGG